MIAVCGGERFQAKPLTLVARRRARHRIGNGNIDGIYRAKQISRGSGLVRVIKIDRGRERRHIRNAVGIPALAKKFYGIERQNDDDRKDGDDRYDNEKLYQSECFVRNPYYTLRHPLPELAIFAIRLVATLIPKRQV